jgi:DNA-binding CsgD family transcriptional regulator/PAS domain-containing protein
LVSNTKLLEVIGHLYDASTDMDKWPVFLEGLCEIFDAPFTNILHFDQQEEKFNFWCTGGRQLPGDMLHILQENFSSDPRLIASNQFPGKPLSCRSSIGETAWHESSTYKACKRFENKFPVIEYSLTVALPDEAGSMTGLAIMRWQDGQAFTQEECDLLGEIIPHLKRAVNLQKRFAQIDFGHRSMLEALDHMPTGIIITDGDGKIKHMNKTAREITDRKDGLFLARDTIGLSHQSENRELMTSIRKAVSSAAIGEILSGHAMSVSRDNSDEPYPLMISTLWGNNIKLGLGILDAPLAAIFVTDPDRPQEAPAELLQRLYGLTMSEARLVERLVAGNTVKDAAMANGITVHTARQYLKAIFQKTGTDRQASLVGKVMSSPIWAQSQLAAI